MKRYNKQVGRTPLAVLLILLVFLALPPLLGTYMISFLFTLFMLMVLAVSWNLLSGYAGYISLGHVAFFGVGAYAFALSTTVLKFPWYISLLAAGLFAAFVAALFGAVSLRIRGAYFSIVTFGLSQVLLVIVVNLQAGSEFIGYTVPPAPSRLFTYYLGFLIAFATVATSWYVSRSKFGLGLEAIREDEDVAETLGVNTFAYKLCALVVGAFFPGLFGAVFAWNQAYIDPYSAFPLFYSFYPMIFVIFGGIGTVLGPIVGTTILTLIQEFLWSSFPYVHQLIFGAIFVFIVIFMPKGILEPIRRRTTNPKKNTEATKKRH